MERLSENFKRSEFTCKCGCGFDTIDAALIKVLQWLRDETGSTVTITSGCRCDKYNESVGGTTNSQHKKGRAADIVVAGLQPAQVYKILNLMYGDKISLGSYKTFTHVDTRTASGARWKR